MCEVLRGRPGETGRVAAHDAGSVADAVAGMVDGCFRVDVPLFESIRALTSDEAKITWMMNVRRDPSKARRSPFWRDRTLLARQVRAYPEWMIGPRANEIVAETPS